MALKHKTKTTWSINKPVNYPTGIGGSTLTPPLPETKVNVVNPLAEIRRLMDEVLLSPKTLALQREQSRIEKELEKLDLDGVRATIKDLFRASLTPEELDEAMNVSVFDLDSAGNGAIVKLLTSQQGEMMMIGLSGPFLVKINNKDSVVEGKGDDQVAVG